MVDKRKKTEVKVEKKKRGPDLKVRKGRFAISLWTRTIVVPPKDEQRGYVPEREKVIEKACIQYSKKWNGVWENQSIWCHPEELRVLQAAMDALDEALVGGDEESPSSHSDSKDSKKVSQ
jgi:hypothetical protein